MPTEPSRKRERNKTREAEIHFELYYHVRKLFEQTIEVSGVTFGRIEPEQPVDSGFADLVIYDRTGRPWCVIEAKRYEKGKIDRNIDPNSLIVIRQALGYATLIGAPYFITYNGRSATLFKTSEKFVPLPERRGKPFDVTSVGLDDFPHLLLREIMALEVGVTEWASIDDRFLARLRTLHEHIAAEVTGVVDKHSHERFRREYREWLELQGWQKDELANKTFSNQVAYLWIGRILFYEVLARKYKNRLPHLAPVRDISQLPTALNQYFLKALAIDYKAVFQLDPIFDLVPTTDRISEALNSFIDEISQYDLASITSDIIGRVYERLIPPEERHKLGQYYTPPKIVSLICQRTIQKANDKILDPSCGSGGFLIGAYDRLKMLPNAKKHEKILQQLFGIDINRFPAHLAVINLAMRDLFSTTDDVKVFVGDFFDVHPSEQLQFDLDSETELAKPKPGDYLVSTPQGLMRRSDNVFIPAQFDVIIANPPYIRQESLNKNKVRAHLSALNIKEFSQRADIFVYFFTHATEFLKAGGRLGFITSHHWLTADYGKDLIKFLHSKYKINAIVAFEKQAFEEPLINTCITFLTYHPDTVRVDGRILTYGKAADRDNNLVYFLRLKSLMQIDEIVSTLNVPYAAETQIDTDRVWLYVKRQIDLAIDPRWKKYLLAPKIYFDILKHPAFVRFEDQAEAVFGLKAGANEFFYLKEEDAKAFRIPKKCLTGLIKGVGQSDYISFCAGDTEWFVLDLHAEIKKALQGLEKITDKKKLIKQVLAHFEAKGWDGLIAYIASGEKEGLHKRDSIINRRVWFDLGPLPKPILAVPKEYWRVAVVYWNTDRLVTDQQFYPVTPKKEVDDEVLCGILNSDVFTLIREVDGREAAGEAMTRNRLTTAELNEIRLPDPRLLSAQSVLGIKEAFQILVKEERVATPPRLVELKKSLNTAVLTALDLAKRRPELEEAVETLLDLRIKTGAYEKGVLLH